MKCPAVKKEQTVGTTLKRPNLNFIGFRDQHEYREARHPDRNEWRIAVQPQMSPPQADDANQRPLQAVANHNPEARKRSYEVTSN